MVAHLFLPSPTEEGCVIDHIDRNKNNNHASNLRWINLSVSNTNKRTRIAPRIDSASEHHHISWNESGQRYDIQLKVGGKRFSKHRKTLEDAITIRDELIASHGLS